MSKWIAEFELEDGDTMPEHMDLQYRGARIDFYCKPLKQEPVINKIRAEIENHCGLTKENHCRYCSYCNNVMGVREILEILDKYTTESEDKE